MFKDTVEAAAPLSSGVHSRCYTKFWTDAMEGTKGIKRKKYAVKSSKSMDTSELDDPALKEGLIHFMNQKHLDLINSGPFKNFLHTPRDLSMSKACLSTCIKLWDVEHNGMRVGVQNTLVRFNASEVSIILGLPIEGTVVDFDERSVKLSLTSILTKYLGGSHWDAHRVVIRIKLFEIVSSDDDATVRDFYKMWVALLFATVLFPASNNSVPRPLYPYIDNLDTHSRVAWGTAVYDFLLRRINNIASSLRQKKMLAHLDGCCIALNVSHPSSLLKYAAAFVNYKHNAHVLTVSQAWMFEHLPTIGQKFEPTATTFAFADLRVFKWLPSTKKFAKALVEVVRSLRCSQVKF